MNLDIGTEKRFLEFVDNLSDEDNIALISHTDVDGITAAFVANQFLDADLIKFVNYEDLNENLINVLKASKINKVVFTDLFLKSESFIGDLEEFADVLILDHHLAQKDWNSKRTVFIKGEDGYCAAYLCYYLFSKVKNMEEIDWLVACASVADYCHVKPAKWLSIIYEKYGDKLENVGLYVRTSGKIWDLQEKISYAIIYFKKGKLNEVFNQLGTSFGDIGNLGEHADQVGKEVERLVELFNKEREVFNGGYLFEFNPKYDCGSIVGTIVSAKEPHKAYVTMRYDSDRKMYRVSARRQDKTVNMADFLNKLLEGFEGADAGGHVPAAGGSFPKKYIEEFRNRLGVKSH